MPKLPKTPAQLREGSSKSSKGGGPFSGIFNQAKNVGKNAQMGARNSMWSAQLVPGGGMGGTRLGDLYGGRGGRGGGGGYDPYAAARAEEERRRAAMRAAIEAQYGGAIGQLGEQNTASAAALGNYHNEAVGRVNPIFANNRALTGQYSQQLAQLAQYATRGVINEGDLLARDLQGQGISGQGLGDLRGVVGSNVTDMLGARSAQDQYNTRLAQLMGTNESDVMSMLSAILQGSQSNRENMYAAELARLQGDQAMKLAELA